MGWVGFQMGWIDSIMFNIIKMHLIDKKHIYLVKTKKLLGFPLI